MDVLLLLPKERAYTGPVDYPRPFFIYSRGVPTFSVNFTYLWEFMLYLYAVYIAMEKHVVINPFFGFWN